MGRREVRAEDLEGLISNLNPYSDLAPDSGFYVDVDRARNSPGDGSVRQLLVRVLRKLAKDNEEEADDFLYGKYLLAGHRASGKTTELRKVAKELEEAYHVIYVSNIERQASRFETEQDFLYYLLDYVITSVKEEELLGRSVEKDVEELYRYFEDSIFSVVQEEKLVTFDHSISGEVGANASAEVKGPGRIFALVAGVFAKISGKAGFEETTKEKITKSIKNNFQEFVEIANRILVHINTALQSRGKMLLLILDGLDKLEEDKARPLFLNADVMLPQLCCSMIVTFPIYLLYSPNKNNATSPYSREPFVLSMIKVHDKEGKPYTAGLAALREIAERRFDTKRLLGGEFSFDKYPEAAMEPEMLPEDFNGVLDAAILMSGGNLRDFFRLLTIAAENAVIFEKERVEEDDLVNAMNHVRSDYIRSYTKSYLPILKEVIESGEKDVAFRENPQDDTLLNIFNSGLLIEYNGVRWCDVHPLIRGFLRRQAGNREA